MAQVNAEVAAAVTGWKRRDDPAYFGDDAITDRCRTHRPVRIIKRNPPPGVGRNRGFACSKNVSPGRAGRNEGPLSRLRRGRQTQHAEQNRTSRELSHSRANGDAFPLNMRMVTGTWSASITATSRMVSDEQYNTSGSLKRIESTILSCEWCRAHHQSFLRQRSWGQM